MASGVVGVDTAAEDANFTAPDQTGNPENQHAENDAAVKIQSLARGRRDRQRVASIKAGAPRPPATPPTASRPSSQPHRTLRPSSQGEPIISIANFDPDNDRVPILTSPRSLTACSSLAISPIELVRLPPEAFGGDSADEEETRRMWQAHEVSRQELVLMVTRQRDKLMAQGPSRQQSARGWSRGRKAPKPRRAHSAREPHGEMGVRMVLDGISDPTSMMEQMAKMRAAKDKEQMERVQVKERRRVALVFKEKLRQTELEEQLNLSLKEAERQREAIKQARLESMVNARLTNQINATLRQHNLDQQRQQYNQENTRKQIARHTRALARIQSQEQAWREAAARGQAEAGMMREWRQAMSRQQELEQEQLFQMQQMTERERLRHMQDRVEAKNRQHEVRLEVERRRRQRQRRHKATVEKHEERRRAELEKKQNFYKEMRAAMLDQQQRRRQDKQKAMALFKTRLTREMEAVEAAVKSYVNCGVLPTAILPQDLTMSPHADDSGGEMEGGDQAAIEASMEDLNPEAVTIARNAPMRSFVEAGQLRFFKIFVTNPGVALKLHSKSLQGQVTMFVGTSRCPYPNPESHCWQQTNGDSIVIHRSDRFFQEGYYYLGVMGLTDAWFVVLAQWTDRQRLQSPKPLGRPVPVLAKIKEQFIDTTVRQLPDNLQDKAVDMIRTWR